MSIEVRSSILIESNREQVAEMMFNPKLDKLWIRGLRAVFPMKSGLYEENAKVERIGVFMNREYSAKLVVTKFEPNRFVEIYSDEPFQMTIRYELNDVSAGTEASVIISSFGEILYNSPVSIISKALRESIEDDLKRLKKHVESNN